MTDIPVCPHCKVNALAIALQLSQTQAERDALTARIAELERERDEAKARAREPVTERDVEAMRRQLLLVGYEGAAKVLHDLLGRAHAAERRETEAKTLQHQLASDLTVAVARAQAAEAKLYAAMDALTFILPLAKGYAHEHPVGANQRHVDEAAETLRALQTKDTTE